MEQFVQKFEYVLVRFGPVVAVAAAVVAVVVEGYNGRMLVVVVLVVFVASWEPSVEES